MASEIIVQTLKGPSSGANANKIIVPSGQELNAQLLTVGSRALKQDSPALVANAGYTNSVSANSWVSLGSWSITTDTHNWFTTSNGRYTPQQAGWYFVSACRRHGYSGVTESGQHYVNVFKNGTNVGESAGFTQASGGYPNWWVHKVVYLNGSSDYVEMKMYDSAAQSNVGGVLEAYYLREGA